MKITIQPTIKYCKVHPFINQPYPCIVCQYEIEEYNRSLVEKEYQPKKEGYMDTQTDV